jgi:hypothetical protein
MNMLRHTLATLAYRAGKVLRDAPDGFSGFTPAAGSRSAGQILAHMGDLMDWAVSIVEGKQTWRESSPRLWDEDAKRFFEGLERFDGALAAHGPDQRLERKLFQGPVADALTHVGQLAMMRRLAGAPIRGENYFVAEIAAGRVSVDQAAPRKEFA